MRRRADSANVDVGEARQVDVGRKGWDWLVAVGASSSSCSWRAAEISEDGPPPRSPSGSLTVDSEAGAEPGSEPDKNEEENGEEDNENSEGPISKRLQLRKGCPPMAEDGEDISADEDFQDLPGLWLIATAATMRTMATSAA